MCWLHLHKWNFTLGSLSNGLNLKSTACRYLHVILNTVPWKHQQAIIIALENSQTWSVCQGGSLDSQLWRGNILSAFTPEPVVELLLSQTQGSKGSGGGAFLFSPKGSLFPMSVPIRIRWSMELASLPSRGFPSYKLLSDWPKCVPPHILLSHISYNMLCLGAEK